jgi:preprotein translocase SecE subunit
VKKYILGLLMAFVAFVAVSAATGDAAQAVGGTDAAVAGATTAPATTTPTATTTTTPATTPRTSEGTGWIGLAIWAAVILGIFFFLWSKGYLVKIRNYFAETQEELKKCSWPSREELRGSTVVVLVTTVLLGLFTVGVDWILSNLMRLIT